MRKNWLLIGIGLLVAVLAIGAIACGDDDDNGDNGDNGNGNGDVLLRLSVTLTEMDSSGASGTAELTVNGEGILVTLSMAGLGEGEGVHANHLHHGTCAEQSEVHITLDNVVADAAGDGSQITANDEQPLTHFESGHYLAVHVAGGAPGAVISCGEVVA